MGLASANGGLMAIAPMAILITAALLIMLTLIIRQSARASVVAGLLFAPVLWVTGLRGPVIWVAIVVGMIITLRFTIDWNREYKELWLDRDKVND
jgi:glycerol-3-phosphate acyltransferase PlsY